MTFSKVLLFAFCSLYAFTVSAKYTETMKLDGQSLNLKQLGLIDDGGKVNQSAIFQNGINSIASKGGGNVVIPKGTYKVAGVCMKSNVHLQIDAGTIIKLDWPIGTKACCFLFKSETENGKDDYIENVSIRGRGGRFTIDYQDHILKRGEGARAIYFCMVRNFLVQDIDVLDNYSTYCAMTLAPCHSKKSPNEIADWEVSRPTDGTIRNCRAFKASPGYGLVQLHGARKIHFQDLYSMGGVALRLETGANNKHVGVYDITGKNITCESGRCALMMGPHSAKNGVVTVDGLTAISCTNAVIVGHGGVKKGAPDQTPGYFSDKSSVKNIHAIFGKTAQIKKNMMLFVPEEYYNDLKIWADNKFMDGPSIGVVNYTCGDSYKVHFENITESGFKHSKTDLIEKTSSRESGNWGEAFKSWFKNHGDKKYKSTKGTFVKPYSIDELVAL